MTRLPQLEAQLVAAAAKRRPRARRPLLIAAGALAAAACVALALLLAPTSKPREQPAQVPETVPAATLVKARALTKAPMASAARIPVDRVLAEAKLAMARTPYPPGTRYRYDWVKNQRRFKNALDVQASVEYTGYCLWVRYWVYGADRAGAGAVLQTYPYWPAQRGKDNSITYWQSKVLTAVRSGDFSTMHTLANEECSRFG